MLYQRKISSAELLSAKLELQLHHARFALVGAQAVGVAAIVALAWYQLSQVELLLWAVGMFILQLVNSMRMSRALEQESYSSHRYSLYAELLINALLTGMAWCASVYWMNTALSDEVFYLVLVVVTIISVVTVAVTCVVREIYLMLLFSTLIPIAAWLGWHFDARPFNLVMAAGLTALALLMGLVSGWMSRSFGDVVELGMEREAMTRDFAELSESLRLRNLQLQEARMQLADIATIDELTGLRNRRGANQVFDTEISRAKRSGISLAVIMIDVDHFKLYNDTYGHPAGDLVLQQVAEVLLAVTSRAGELAVRMGGEEFLLVLPGSTQGDAMSTAEAVKERILDLAIPHEASLTEKCVTVSQGVVACVPRLHTEISDLVSAADQALYASKESGRNRITLSPFSP